MKDAYAAHTHEDGVVNEIGDGIQGFVATHAAHIEVLPEVLAVGVDGLACLAADAIGVEALLAVLGFRFRLDSRLQSFQAHLRTHISENHRCHLAVDALDVANRLQTLDAYGGSDDQ